MYSWGYPVLFGLCLIFLVTSLPFNVPNPMLVLYTFACFTLPYMLWFTDVKNKRRTKLDRLIEKLYDLMSANKTLIAVVVGLGLIAGALAPIYPLAFVSFGMVLALIAFDHVRDPRTINW